MRAILLLIGCLACLSAAPAWSKDCSFVTQEYLDRNGHGVMAARWCLQCATSRINEHPFQGNCSRYVLSWGDKHQNALGKDAIVAACRGEFDGAVERIEICQCHNPGAQAAMKADRTRMFMWMQSEGAALAGVNCAAEGSIAVTAAADRASRQNGPQLTSSCIQKRTRHQNGIHVIVEVSNMCGRCAHVSTLVTLNGSPYGPLATRFSVPPGGAFDVPYFMNDPGTYNVEIGQVFACPS